ncbi:MAG: site-specific DNA-methyltransferase [Chitinophagaceae bacterium]|nr:site-specific DNA-methyltransferase [Chitinophagaceae bacterium]
MPRISETNIIKDESLFANIFPKYLKTIDNLQSRFQIEQGTNFETLVNFKHNRSIPKHNWFDYKHGFAEELVKTIIEMEKPSKSKYVLDPFAGVGTTNLVAQSLGYKSIGFDINPIAHLASKVKTNYYSENEVDKIKIVLENFNPEETKSFAFMEKVKVIENSFHPSVLKKLLVVKNFIKNLQSEEKIKEFLSLAFLSIIEDCSTRVKDGNGIKLKVNKKYIENVYDYFLTKCHSMIGDIKKSNFTDKAVFFNNSLIEIKERLIEDNSIGICIYSPPYANCFDYCEVYKLELWFSDFVQAYDDFKKYRAMAMRSHVNSQFDHNIKHPLEEVETIAKTISAFNLWNKNIPDMIQGYFDDTYVLLNKLKPLYMKCILHEVINLVTKMPLGASAPDCFSNRW